jgi:hypothetical protein
MIGKNTDFEVVQSTIRSTYSRVVTSQWTIETARERLLETLSRVEQSRAMIRDSDAFLQKFPPPRATVSG